MSSPPQIPTPLYETLTLSPLSPPISHTLIPSPPSEPYTVFRSEISLSTPNCESSDGAAPDYFSLEVGEHEPKTPTEVGEPKKRVEPDSEPLGLESSWFRGNSRFKSPMLQLHKEMVDFCEFLSPTPEEQASRNTAVESVSNVIRYIWPACKVEVFGSFRTGLYLPSSDIDVVILESGIKNPQLGLQALSRALSQKGIAKKMQVIAKARVPIIKFVEKRSGVSFDISFDLENGPKAADIIKDAVSKWAPLRPLCLILKVFLQQRELNEVYSGGIGSYALLTMLMAMLQNLRNNRTFPEHNLGVLLVHFFDFYGRKLNTADVGVSCRGGTTFFSKHSRGFLNKGRPFLISIEDPQAPDNDIGKNSFNYFQIRSAFSMAFSTLTNSKILLGLGPNKSILGTIIRPDPVLVERKGGQNGDVTFNSLLPGAGEPLQSQWDHHQEILGNWQFNDEEETLLRGTGIFGETSAQSSGKKRKSVSKDKSNKKKFKDNGEVGKVRHEGNSSRKDKETKKQRWRNNHNNVNGCSHSNGGSPWTR